MTTIEDLFIYGESVIPIMPQFCNICGKLSWGWNTKKIGFYGEYGFHDRYTFHPECVNDAIQNPEKYGHHAVDVALDVFRCIEFWTNRDKKNAERQREYRLAELRRIQGLDNSPSP